MRYWLSQGDGKTHGPYDLDTLRGYASSGRLMPQSMVCGEGSNQWIPVGSILGAGVIAPAPPAAHHAGGYAPIGMVGPILATVFCCLPGGIISLVYASQAQTKFAQGDLAGSMQASKTSRTWIIVSVVVGIVAGVLSILAALAGGSTY